MTKCHYLLQHLRRTVPRDRTRRIEHQYKSTQAVEGDQGHTGTRPCWRCLLEDFCQFGQCLLSRLAIDAAHFERACKEDLKADRNAEVCRATRESEKNVCEHCVTRAGNGLEVCVCVCMCVLFSYLRLLRSPVNKFPLQLTIQNRRRGLRLCERMPRFWWSLDALTIFARISSHPRCWRSHVECPALNFALLAEAIQMVSQPKAFAPVAFEGSREI
jgi:hypothetical protein